MTVEDLNAQWYDTKNTWDAVHAQAKELDELINAFNDEVGLLKALLIHIIQPTSAGVGFAPSPHLFENRRKLC